MISYLLAATLSNTIVACILAVAALGVDRLWRNPHVTRALWLVVLIKLVTPPLFSVDIGAMWAAQSDSTTVSLLDIEKPVASTPSIASEPITFKAIDGREPSDSLWNMIWPNIPRLLISLWGVGVLVFGLILAIRFRAFRRMLASANWANTELMQLAQAAAEQAGLRRCPEVLVLSQRIPPFVWGLASPQIVLPRQLVEELTSTELRSVLLHEMAHIRRGDVAIRWFETLVLAACWWNPLAWLARAASRRAEEMCCDAAVIEMNPEHRRDYGRALFHTVEFLAGKSSQPAVFGAPFGAHLFQRRIEMVVKEKACKAMSWWQWSAIVAVALVVLPLAGNTGGQEETEVKEKKTRAPATQAATNFKKPAKKTSSLEERIARLEAMVEKLVGSQKWRPSKTDTSIVVAGPHDRVFAVVEEKQIILLDAKTGDVMQKVKLDNPASNVAFDAKGERLIYRTGDKVYGLEVVRTVVDDADYSIDALAVEQAKTHYERLKQLATKGFVDKASLQAAEARLAASVAQQRAQRIQRQAEIRAAELEVKASEVQYRRAVAEQERLGPKYVREPGIEAVRAKFAVEEAAIQVEKAKAQLQLLRELYDQQ